MTEHPLLAAIPPDQLGDLLDTTPVGSGLITVTAIPAGEWGERAVIAWWPVGGTARVVAATTLHDPADVPHAVAEFTATLRQVLPPVASAPAKRRRTRVPGVCSRCGDTAAQWCPDCEACRLGCFATRAANPCTHPNAPWNTELTP